MSRLVRPLVLPALIALLTGCQPVTVGGDDGGIDGSEGADARVSADAEVIDAVPVDPCIGEVAFEDAAECYRGAICDMYVRCMGLFGTVEECLAADFGRLNPDTMFRRFDDGIAADRINYDPGAAGECFAAIRELECAFLMEGDGPGPACDLVFTGTVGDTGSCYASDECVGGGYCEDLAPCSLQCCVGACEARAPLGFSCDTRSCVRGAHCVNTPGAGNLCQPGEANSPCASAYDCDQDFWCDFSGGPGLCAADFPANAGCSEDEQCPLPQLCVGDDTTSGIGTCARADTLAASCDSECYGPFYCNIINPGELGNCSPFPGLGQSCGVSNRCAGQLICNTNTNFCVERLPLDGVCTNTNQCQLGLVCSADLPAGPDPGQCRNPVVNGQPCSYDEQCVSEVCAGSPALCEAYENCYE